VEAQARWNTRRQDVAEQERLVLEELRSCFVVAVREAIRKRIDAILDDKQFLRDIDALVGCLTALQTHVGEGSSVLVDVLARVKSRVNELQSDSEIQNLIEAKNYAKLLSNLETLCVMKPALEGWVALDIINIQTKTTRHVSFLLKQAGDELQSGVEHPTFLVFTAVQDFVRLTPLLEKRFPGEMEAAMHDLIQMADSAIRKCVAQAKEMLEIARADGMTTGAEETVARMLIKGYAVAVELGVTDQYQKWMETGLLNQMESKSQHLVGIAIKLKSEDSNASVASAANGILAMFPAFKTFRTEQFNAKAGGVTFPTALEKMKCMPTRPSNDNLVTVFGAYDEVYSAEVDKIVHGLKDYSEDALRKRVAHLVKKLAPHVEELNQHCLVFGQLFALVASAWTYLSCLGKGDFQERKSVLQPHNTQVLGVCRLMGLDEAALGNHLIQINTGEGKSVALGFTAVLLSLLGFSVDVVCYSSYLSERDYQEFKQLFQFFGVEHFVTYSDFDGLSSSILKSGADVPNIREKFVQFLRGNTAAPRRGDNALNSLVSAVKNLVVSPPAPAPIRRKVLLLDEVDVFFSDAFYGQPYLPSELLHDADGGSVTGYNLLLHVWQRRGSLSKSKQSVAVLREHMLTKQLLSKFPNLAFLLEAELYRILDSVSQFPAGRAPRFRSGEDAYTLDAARGTIVYTDPRTHVPTEKLSYGYVTAFTYFYECDRGKFPPATFREAGQSSSKIGVLPVCGALSYSEIPRLYAFALGMTGTLDCLTEKQDALLKEYFFERRTFLPSTFFGKKSLNADRGEKKETKVVRGTRDDYFLALKDEMAEAVKEGRAVLMVFADLKGLQDYNYELHRYGGVDFPRYAAPQLLTDELDNGKRNNVVIKAIRPYTITLMTRAYGRGTDFKCDDPGLVKDGGAHVIITFFPEDDSEEKQILGRTCREDYPGSARKIIFEDDLEPLGASERLWSAQNLPWDAYLAQCRAATHEKRMAQMDAAHEKVMARHNATLQACEATDQKQWEEAARRFNEAAHPEPEAETSASDDICFVMDCSGSMARHIDACQDQVMTIAEGLQGRGGNVELRMAFVAYRDYDSTGLKYDEDDVKVCPFTKDLSVLRSMVRSQKPVSGRTCDVPEDLCGGLRAALSLGWGAQNRHLFIIADMPCHGNDYHQLPDNFPEGDPKGDKPEEQIAKLTMGLEVSVKFIVVTPHTESMLDVINQRLRDTHGFEVAKVDLSNCADQDQAVEFGRAIQREVAREWVHMS